MTESTDVPAETDAHLLTRCQRGDGAAWEALVVRYQRLVYAIVRRIGLDEHSAADVFQTVFMRLMEHLPRLTDPNRLQAWIVTTAKREALLQRKRGMRAVSMTRVDDEDGPTSEWDVADDSFHFHINSVIIDVSRHVEMHDVTTIQGAGFCGGRARCAGRREER